MGHLCDDIPKPMLTIQGRPKLAYTLEALPDTVREVILLVGYHKDTIMEYFGSSYAGRSIRYAVHDTIDGTGKILHSVKDMVRNRFLVIMGDDLYHKKDLDSLIQQPLGILAMEVEDSLSFGVLKVDEKNNVIDIVERPHDPSYTLVNTGAYMLTTQYFSYPLVRISETEYGLPQTLVQMRDKHVIRVVKARDWFPVGDPQALQEAQERIRDFI